MSWMLRLYPRAWRRRYGEEVAELIASQPRSFRLWLDLLAGAMDARMNPQWSPAPATASGGNQMQGLLRLCTTTGFAPGDRRRGNRTLILSSLGLVALALVMQLGFGMRVLSQTLLFSAYPVSLILAGQCTYLKPYPRWVRVTLTAAAAAGMFTFILLVTLLAEAL